MCFWCFCVWASMGKRYVTAVYRNFEVETSSSNSFCCYRSQVQRCLPTKMEQGNTVIPWSHISCVKLFLHRRRLNLWCFSDPWFWSHFRSQNPFRLIYTRHSSCHIDLPTLLYFHIIYCVLLLLIPSRVTLPSKVNPNIQTRRCQSKAWGQSATFKPGLPQKSLSSLNQYVENEHL